ncbi:TonB-dependent receptor [Brevundimonas sp.]|uniref:TonB-dependent receptor n=1 Tax=Brevundimonas sp. TaxID=1871086 RepID=UPI002D3028E0|nr:TonB-dependent receptor [Brevundimonas sp.]HYD26780.1 TonB-dependent receptor [Brevundimonas sp.]
MKIHTAGGARRALMLAGVSAAVLTAVPAVAQEQPQAAEQVSTVEEVVVTARRREERLQDVPVAVTALSSEALENLQATDIGDLQGAVPNLTLHEGDAANAVVYLRGVGQVDSLAFADPGVGVYVDDVYLGRAQGAFLSVYDVDRIEVLRGPQGTLYGRNTIGGAVKFVSTPLSAEWGGRAEASVGDYGLVESRISVGGALNGDATLLGKAAVSLSRRDGYSDNAFDGMDDGDKDQVAGRVSLEYRPTDALSVRLNVDASRDRPDTSRTPARATPVLGLYPDTMADPFEVDADFNDLNTLDTFGAALTADWALSDLWSFKSVTAWRSMDYASHLDLDATPLAVFGVYVDEDQHQFSQEFQLTYAGERLNAVAGVFYFDESDLTYSGLLGPVISLVTGSINDQHNRSWAAYGQATYDLSERLSLTAGLRYTYEDKDFRRTQTFYGPLTEPPARDDPGLLVTDIDTSESWDSWSPKLGLDYAVSDDVMAYVSVSRGFKSGGFDGRANDASGAAPYDPETLWAYEAGVKSTLMDRRLTANMAVFWNDYTDLQLSSFSADGGGGFIALFTNAGAATIRGAELELTARPVAELTLNATVGYLDARYDEYIGPGGVDISDQRHLVNAPEWSARLGGVYVADLGVNGSLTLGADASYRSKVYPTVSSSEVLAQDGYTLVDAFVRWSDRDDHLFVQLGGQNLTDERHIEQGFDLSDSLGYQLAYFGAPRTVRLTAGFNF